MFFRRDLLRSYSYLALLLELGEPLHRALPAVRHASTSKALEKFWEYVENRVREGETLSEVLGRKREPAGMVSLLRAGEANGNVIAALRQMAGRHLFNPDATRRYRGEASSLDEEGSVLQGPLIRIAHTVIQQTVTQRATAFALHPGWPSVRGTWPPLEDLAPSAAPPQDYSQAYGRAGGAFASAGLVEAAAAAPGLPSNLSKVAEMVGRYGVVATDEPEERSPMMGIFYRMAEGWQESMRLQYHIAPPLTRRFLFMAGIPYWAQERCQGRIGINYQGRDYDLELTFDPKHAPVLRAEIESR